MQADAETREEILLMLGEFRAAVSQKRLEGVLSLFAPDADATLIGSATGEIARGPIELRSFLERTFTSEQAIAGEWDDVSISCAGDVAWRWRDGKVAVSGCSVTVHSRVELGSEEQRHGGQPDPAHEDDRPGERSVD